MDDLLKRVLGIGKNTADFLRSKARETRTFIQKNPTPVGFAVKPIQQKIQSFGERYPNFAGFLTKTLEPAVEKTKRFLSEPYKPVKLPDIQISSPKNKALDRAVKPFEWGYNYLAKPIAEGVINFPTHYVGGITRTGLDLGRMARGEKVPVRQLAGDVARIGKGIMDVSVFSAGKKVAVSAAEQAMQRGFLSVMKTGAKAGAKFGASYGGLQGLMDAKDTKDLFDYTKRVLGATTGGAVGGAVVGGGAAATGYVAGKIIGTLASAIRRLSPEKSQKQAVGEAKQFIRDELGRFVGGKRRVEAEVRQKLGMAPDEPVYYSDLRKSLGLPEDGDYQKGAIDLSAKVEMPFKKSIPPSPKGAKITPKSQLAEAIGGAKTAGMGGGATPIPLKLESLAQEARKYKSAEEIIRNVTQSSTLPGGRGIQGRPITKEEVTSLANYFQHLTTPENKKWFGKVVRTWTGDNDVILGVTKNKNTSSTEYVVMSLGNKNPEYRGIMRVHSTPLREKDIVADFYTQATKGVEEGTRVFPQGKKTATPVTRVAAPNEIVDTIREAIASGDEAGAKALHKDFATEYELPALEILQKEVEDAFNRELKAVKPELGSQYGEYKDIALKMKNFLRIAGEKKSKETGELFREHIPRRVFGVSSDEVSSALEKTESEFMAELTKDIQMIERGSTTPKVLASFKQKINKLKTVYDKLDPAFYKVLKDWDNKVRAVVVEPSAKITTKATKQAQLAREREATAIDKEWTKHVFESTKATITQKQKLNNAIKTIEKSIKENTSDGLPPPTNPDVPLTQKPGLLERIKKLGRVLIQESRGILNDMGTNGKEAAKRLDNYYNNAERMAGGAVADYNKSVGKLSDATVEKINRALDGQEVSLTPHEAKIYSTFRGFLNNYADEAIKARMEIALPNGTKVQFQPRDNYLPHIVDINKLITQKDTVIQHLMDTRQLPDITTASVFVNDIIAGGSVSDAYHKYFPNALPHRYGNLEMARVIDWPEEVLRYDRKLLPDYFQAAANRIHISYQFGPNNEIVDKMLSNIAQEGGDYQLAEKIIKKNLGILREDRVIQQGIGAIRQVEAATKLGLAAVSNVGQSVNTATRFGIVPTIRNIFRAFKPESRDFALRTGATLEESMREFENEVLGAGGWQKITAPGFRAVEKFNRVVASNTGRDFVAKRFDDLLTNPKDTIAMKDLEKMEVNVQEALKRGKLTTEELLKAGQRAVNLTQFKTRPLDLPPTWSSSVGKLLTQFKTFSYKHGQFIANEVFKPAITEKNFAPLARYLVLGLVVGEVISDIKAFVRRRERPQGVARALDNMASVGGMGLLQDAINAAGRGPEAMLSFIAGPTISDVAKAAGGLGLAVQGKPKTLAHFILGNIPIVGQPIANTLIPPRGAYKSRTPDLIQEAIGMTPEQSVQEFLADKQKYTEMDEADVKAQLASVRKQKKEIIEKKGFLGFGMSEEEKNAKLEELTREENALKNATIFKDINKYMDMPEENGLQRARKIEAKFKIADKLLSDEDRSPEEKLYTMKTFLGMNEYDAGYYEVARQEKDIKQAFIIEQLSVLPKDVDATTFLTTLRYKVGGKMILSDEVISQLYEDGYINKTQKKTLQNIKYDPKTGISLERAAAEGLAEASAKKRNAVRKQIWGDIIQTLGQRAKFKLEPPKLNEDFFRKARPKTRVARPRSLPYPESIASSRKISYTKTEPLSIDKLIANTQVKLPQTNIARARQMAASLRGPASIERTPRKLSRSFFRVA